MGLAFAAPVSVPVPEPEWPEDSSAAVPAVLAWNPLTPACRPGLSKTVGALLLDELGFRNGDGDGMTPYSIQRNRTDPYAAPHGAFAACAFCSFLSTFFMPTPRTPLESVAASSIIS